MAGVRPCVFHKQTHLKDATGDTKNEYISNVASLFKWKASEGCRSSGLIVSVMECHALQSSAVTLRKSWASLWEGSTGCLATLASLSVHVCGCVFLFSSIALFSFIDVYPSHTWELFCAATLSVSSWATHWELKSCRVESTAACMLPPLKCSGIDKKKWWTYIYEDLLAVCLQHTNH